MELFMTVPYKESSEKITVSDKVFAKEFNEPLVHQVVVAYLAGNRAGTKAQKTRGEVRGGGSKPWRQKGTGRARAGTIRSPLWRKGGRIFAAKMRDYSQKVNKKMYREALRSIFSELVRQKCLIIVEDFKIAEPKTRVFREKLKTYDLERVFIITEEIDENLYLSSRNIPLVKISDVASINPVNLIDSDKVLITVSGIRQLEDWLK